jgi:hypothetical protein
MRYALTFLLMATVALGQGVWPKTATVVDGGHRYDFDTLGKRSVMPESIFADCVLFQAFSYSDNSDADFYDLALSTSDSTQSTSASQPTWQSTVGGSYSFDGLDDYVVVPSTAIGSVSDYTVSIWVYADQTNATKFVMGWQESGATDPEKNYLAMYVSGGTWRAIDRRQSASGVTLVGSTSTKGAWVMVTSTAVKNGNITIYQNGTSIGSASGIGNTTMEQNHELHIGSRAVSSGGGPVSSGLYWEGSIGDVRIYDTALTAAQIGAIYTNTAPTYGISP